MYLCDLSLATFLKKNLLLSALTPQSALFRLWSDNTNYGEPFINHVLLIIKLHVYNSREKHFLNIMNLLNNIKGINKYRTTFTFQQRKNK